MKNFLVALKKIGVLKDQEIEIISFQNRSEWEILYLQYNSFTKPELKEYIQKFRGAGKIKNYEKLSQCIMAFKIMCSVYLMKSDFDKKSKRFLIGECELKDYNSAITSIKNSKGL